MPAAAQSRLILTLTLLIVCVQPVLGQGVPESRRSDDSAEARNALEGSWTAIRGSVFGAPLPEAALPLVRFAFERDSASWTLPGLPQRFVWRLSGGAAIDSLDFELPTSGGRRWIVPVRVWQHGDTLELSLMRGAPFDSARGAPPTRPAERGPVEIEGHINVVLVRAAAAPRRPAPVLEESEAAAAAAVDADRIEQWTRTLVAPEMAGRGSGQPGGERAAHAIAQWFADVGLEPLGEDGFLQRVPLILGQPTSSSSLTVDDTTFRIGIDFQLTGLGMRTRPAMRASLSGELVLFAGGVGFGRADAPLPRLDVDGKVVGWLLPATTPGSDVFRTYEALHASGAAAIVLLFPGPTPAPMFRSPLFSLVPALDTDLYGGRPGIPTAILGAGPFAELFGDGTVLLEFMARASASLSTVEPTGRQVTISYELEDIADAPTYNVVGVIRGTDPTLRDEAVVYTAHYDALGIANGTVYTGAADNALGTAEMIEIARAMTASGTRPRRSIVFIAAGAEESGVLGSLHWVRNPTWPLDRVVANINIDGGDAEAFGPLHGVFDLLPHLGLTDLVARIAAAAGLPVLPNDEPPGNGSSDFHDFLRAGIPATQLMGTGGAPEQVYARYERFVQAVHQPGDVIGDEWDWVGPRQMAQVYLLLGLRIANADGRPGFPSTSPFSEARPGEVGIGPTAPPHQPRRSAEGSAPERRRGAHRVRSAVTGDLPEPVPHRPVPPTVRLLLPADPDRRLTRDEQCQRRRTAVLDVEHDLCSGRHSATGYFEALERDGPQPHALLARDGQQQCAIADADLRVDRDLVAAVHAGERAQLVTAVPLQTWAAVAVAERLRRRGWPHAERAESVGAV